MANFIEKPDTDHAVDVLTPVQDVPANRSVYVIDGSVKNQRPLMILLAVVALLIVAGFGAVAALALSASRPFSPGVGGMGFFWVFPVFGFVIMLTMMFFFFSLITRQRGPMDWMRDNWSGHTQYQPHRDQAGLHCPSCGSATRQDWIVCPHCGTSLD